MNRHRVSGFTLTELAIVLVIVALLSGGLVVTLSSQMLLRDNRDTDQTLSAAVEALIGYAASHTATATGRPHLPCPDTTGDGREDRSGTACVSNEGFFPWADLGAGQKDAWNNRLRYRVHGSFADSANGFSLVFPTTGPSVCTVAGTCGASTDIARFLPAIVISHGQNGFGATSSAGTVNVAPTGSDELENTDGDDYYVSRTPSPQGANEFDDRVVWLSPYILFSRMIAAGKLP